LIKKIVFSIFLILVIFKLLLASFQHISQKKNIEDLLAQKLDGRMVPHEVNSFTKLNSILESGIRSFELDLFFQTKDNSISCFEIGHDKEDLGGTTFETYLKKIKPYKIKKIWMDVKNVSDKNIDLILNHLNYLDERYHIKSIIIFESSLQSEKLKKISDAGFHTSCYLFNNPVDQMLSTNNNKLLKEEANRIKIQIAKQHSEAISFNSSLYPFIKTYLEPIIPKDIVYHTWKSVEFKDRNAIKSIKKKKYFYDKRMKTILYYYYKKE